MLNYTEEQLKACAEAYDPELFKAPLVVGHPTMDAPAYGWAGSLSYADGMLQLDVVDQLDAEFAETVNDGRYAKISPSFYLPDSPNNPKPGTLYLKHVGFLGAAAPAVKGLKTVSFSEDEEGVVSFADWDQMSIANLFRKVRELIITKFGTEDADKALPSYEIDSLQINAAQERDRHALHFSESNDEPNQGDDMTPEQQAEMDKLKAENATLKADNDAKGTQIASFAEAETTRQKAATHDGNVSFAEGLIKEGKLLPADKDSTIATLDQLAAATGEVSFGEGDDKKTLTPLEVHKAQLAKAPKVVEFGEHAQGEEAGVVSFAAADGYSVDAAALETHNKAQAYATQHGVAYEVALSKVK